MKPNPAFLAARPRSILDRSRERQRRVRTGSDRSALPAALRGTWRASGLVRLRRAAIAIRVIRALVRPWRSVYQSDRNCRSLWLGPQKPFWQPLYGQPTGFMGKWQVGRLPGEGQLSRSIAALRQPCGDESSDNGAGGANEIDGEYPFSHRVLCGDSRVRIDEHK
jgi:hypothetical protein